MSTVIETRPSQTPSKVLYTQTEAAAMLGVSVDTVRRWIRDGSLRSFKVGGKGHPRITRGTLAHTLGVDEDQLLDVRF